MIGARTKDELFVSIFEIKFGKAREISDFMNVIQFNPWIFDPEINRFNYINLFVIKKKKKVLITFLRI